MDHIAYRKGYKYQLAEDYAVKTAIRPQENIENEFLHLCIDGWLCISKGYAWDGPSGPTFDTPSSMRGSLIHDALYQLMREKRLPPERREDSDKELLKACVEDKMWKWRARQWFRKVRKFAGGAADPKNRKRVYLAPR